ncbi:MAG TPA: hypothetical protein VGL88_08915, partial [Pseudonocardiaceae bacterium]
MSEPDADQILTVEELRSLRDRMGADAAPPRVAAGAAEVEVPRPATAIPLEADTDPWEDLRRRARAQRPWAELRWLKPVAVAGCLVVAGGAITMLVITGRTTRSVPPPTVEVSRPAVSAPPVATAAPTAVPSTPALSIIPPAPVVAPPSPPAGGTIEPRATAVAPPPTTHRAKRPNPATPSTARPSPPMVAR